MSHSDRVLPAIGSGGLISGCLPDANGVGGVVNLSTGGSPASAPSPRMEALAINGRAATTAKQQAGESSVASTLLVEAENGYASRARDVTGHVLAAVPNVVAQLVLIGGPRLVRAMVADLIDAQPGMSVENSFASVEELEEHCRAAALDCDVIVLDVDDCRSECAETIDRLLSIGLESKLVLLAAETTDEIVLCANSRRVDGVVLKESSVAELYAAIAHIRTGHAVMPARWRAVPDTVALTPRHVDVLELVAQGYSNEEIAQRLGLRPNTVKFHISEIFRRLGVRNRIEAIAQVDRDGALVG
jgi:DNA-binding NarL/FixJ family response regulator